MVLRFRVYGMETYLGDSPKVSGTELWVPILRIIVGSPIYGNYHISRKLIFIRTCTRLFLRMEKNMEDTPRLKVQGLGLQGDGP